MINSSFLNFQQQNQFFGRAYSLAMGAPNQVGALVYGNIGTDPAPLKIKFDIDKNSLGSSNKAKIEIYNLSQQTRQAIKKGYIVQLKAGYQSGYDIIFTGNILPNGIGSKRSNADIITTIECGDGESAIVMAALDKSYPAGITALQILRDCATAMNLENSVNPEGISSGIVFLPNNTVYNKGFVAKGPASATLDKICKPLGLEWSVQNNNLNVIPKTGHNGQTAILISKDTGMIGVPSQNDQMTKFTALLNPRIVPGSLIKLESENTLLNGFYRIRRSHFEGDTHDNKWQVETECISMPNVVQQYSNINLLQGNIA